MYICSRCYREMDHVFGKRRGRSLCESCYAYMYQREHIDAHHIRMAKYRSKYKEEIRVRMIKFRKEHPDKVKEYARNSYRNFRTKHLEKMHTMRAKALGLFVENVVWTKIYDRDKGLCQLCFKPVDFYEMSLDHIVPFSKGGKHEEKNVQLCHKVCNYKKNRYVRSRSYFN